MSLPSRRASGADAALCACRACVYAAVVLTPLPFGSVQPLAVFAAQALGCIAGALAGAALLLDPGRLPSRARPAIVVLGVALALGTLQLVPLPASLLRSLGSTAQIQRDLLLERVGDLAPLASTWSISAPDGFDALLRLCGWAWFVVAAAVAFDSRPRVARLLGVVLASALFQATYGAAEYVSGRQHIFGYAKRHYLDSATGTFINRNHFATYLAAALPIALSRIVRAPGNMHGAPEWLTRIVGGHTGIVRALPWTAAAIALVCGIFLSSSRAGLAVSWVGAGALLASSLRRRAPAFGFIGIFLVAALLLLGLEVRAPGERFVDAATGLTTLENRLPAWRATVADLDGATLAVGRGYGTFESGFRRVQPPQLRARWDHAHSDWLEIVVEGGLAALLLALALAYFALRRVGPGSTAAAHDLRIVGACGASALAIAVHAAIDFPLRIPALGVLLAVFVGLLLGQPAAEAAELRALEPSRAAKRVP